MTMLLINYDNSYMYNTYSMIQVGYYPGVVGPGCGMHFCNSSFTDLHSISYITTQDFTN